MIELLTAAAGRGDAPAVVTPAEWLSWAELARRAAAVDVALTDAGIGAGEPVAIWLPNGADWLVAFWGIVRGARLAVPLSTFSPPVEIVRLLAHAGARGLVTTTGFTRIDAATVLTERQTLPLLAWLALAGGGGEPPPGTVRFETLSTRAGASPPPVVYPPGAAAVVQYTSGTTGVPKGALLPAAGLLQSARVHAAAWRLVAGDAVFVPNPFAHILGLTYGVLTVAAAAGTTLTQAQFDVDGALALLAAERAVAMTGAPAHLSMLAEHPRLATTDLGALRLAMTGGAPLDVAGARRIRERLGLASLLNGYGMSEVGSVAQTDLDDPPERAMTTVGRPMPGLDTRLVDPLTGGDVAIGEIGELWLRGPAVMLGYHGEPASTAAAFAESGWLRTGDLLRRDATGRLGFVGRRADVIAVGGFDVLVAEVEAVLRGAPGVVEAQVVAAPHPHLGAVPVAFVRLADGRALDRAALDAHCRAALRSYMLPRHYEVVPAMPLGPTGKVDRQALRRRAVSLAEPA